MKTLKTIVAVTFISMAMSSTVYAGNYGYFSDYAPVFQEAFDAG